MEKRLPLFFSTARGQELLSWVVGLRRIFSLGLEPECFLIDIACYYCVDIIVKISSRGALEAAGLHCDHMIGAKEIKRLLFPVIRNPWCAQRYTWRGHRPSAQGRWVFLAGQGPRMAPKHQPGKLPRIRKANGRGWRLGEFGRYAKRSAATADNLAVSDALPDEPVHMHLRLFTKRARPKTKSGYLLAPTRCIKPLRPCRPTRYILANFTGSHRRPPYAWHPLVGIHTPSAVKTSMPRCCQRRTPAVPPLAVEFARSYSAALLQCWRVLTDIPPPTGTVS